MPQIPLYESQVGVPHINPRTDVHEAPRIVDTSAGLRNLTNAVGDVVVRENQRRDTRDLMDYDQKLSEIDRISLQGDEETPGALTKVGRNAAGVTNATLASWDKQADAIAPKLRSADAQARAQQMRTVRRQDTHERLWNHELGQGRIADEEATESAKATYANDALANADDPKMVEANLARGRSVIMDQAKTNGWDIATATQKLAAWESGTLKGVIASQLSRNPLTALATFKAKGEDLVGADRLAVQSALKPYVLDAQGRSLGQSLYEGGTPTVAAGTDSLYNAIHQVESNGQQYGKSGAPLLGPAPLAGGARSQGIGQMQPATAQATAKAAGIPWVPALFNHTKDGTEVDQQAIDYNVKLSNAHIDALVTRFGGNVAAVAAAYNMGPEAARAWAAGVPYKTQSGKQWTPKGPMDLDALPTETRNYIAKVTGRMGGDPTTKPKPVDPRDAVAHSEADALRRAYQIENPDERDAAMQDIRQRAGIDQLALQERERAAQAAKAQLLDQYNNTVGKLGDGVAVPLPERPSRESLVATFGEYEGGQKYDEMQTYARVSPDVMRLKTATVDEAAAIIDGYKPDPKGGDYVFAAKLHDGLTTAFKAIQTERNTNPATYLMANSPVLQGSYAELTQAQQDVADAPNPQQAMEAVQSKGNAFVSLMLSEQARLGVPVKNRAVLPKSAVLAIGDDFQSHMDKGDVAGAVGVMRSALAPFGDGAVHVIPQLGKNQGMVGRMALEGIDERTIETYAAGAAAGDKELEKGVGTQNWNKIKTAVRANLAALDATGTSEWSTYFDASVTLAAQKMRQQGALGDADTVAQQATGELINDRYAFGGTGEAVNYRVPKADIQGRMINTDAVMQGAAGTLNALTIADFTPTDAKPPGVSLDEFKELRLARIQRTGVWINNGDETGLQLGYTDDNGRNVRVLDAAGQPITKTWAQLATTKTSETPEARQLRQRAASIGAGL